MPVPNHGERVRMRWLDSRTRTARIEGLAYEGLLHIYEPDLIQIRDKINALLAEKSPWERREDAEAVAATPYMPGIDPSLPAGPDLRHPADRR